MLLIPSSILLMLLHVMDDNEFTFSFLSKMGDQKSRVNVHSVLTQVSSGPSASVETYPLTRLDHAMGHHTIHVIFYYEKSPFGSFDMDPIRVTLSEVLSSYPPVTGRLTRDDAGNWAVKCNDAGVRVLRARVGVTLDEWLRSADGNEERDLTVWEDMPEVPNTWSPFRIQLNDFEGGGVAIGLSCTHMHGDLTSLILLFKAFSEAHHRQAITFPPFFKPPAPPDRKLSVNNSKSTSYVETKLQKQTPSVKMSTATFKFSDSVVKQCLSEIHDKCPDASPFDLLAALFYIRVVHLKGPKHDDHTHSLSLCVDFRRLLQEPLPYGYFGNALNFSLLSLNEEEMDCSMLGRVAELVHCHVSSLKEEEFWATLHWLDLQKEEGGKYAPPFAMYGPELTCVSMEHMIIGDQPVMYSMNFDSAKPVHVSCHVGNAEGEGLILVMPSAEAGLARTVMVTLPEEETAKLCEDQSILCLKPTMLLRSI